MKRISLIITALLFAACGQGVKFEPTSSGALSGMPKPIPGVDNNGAAPGDNTPIDDTINEPALMDLAGCSTDASGDSQKVLICHIPPGNPAAKHTICIGRPALPAHMKHTAADGEHDYLGECKAGGPDASPTPAPSATPTPAPDPGPGASPTPNPQFL